MENPPCEWRRCASHTEPALPLNQCNTPPVSQHRVDLTCPICVLMATLDRGCAAAHMLAYSCCRASSSSLRCRLRRNRPTCSSSEICEHSHLSRFLCADGNSL